MSTEAPTPRARGRQTVGDMVRSMALVLAFVAVLVIFNVVQEPEQRVRALDYPAAMEQREIELTFTPEGPIPLPPGWAVTSARAGRDGEATTWHLGMLTAADGYVAVEQSDGNVEDLVSRYVEGAEPDGEVEIAGERWQRLAGGDPEPRALVRRGGEIATMVTGNAGWADLTSVAASLAQAP